MRRSGIILTGILVLVLLSVGEQKAVGAEQVDLVVEVSNGTAGGKSVSGNEVIVRIYKHDEVVNTLNGKVDDNGRVIFEDVQAGEHVMASARAFHDGMRFSGKAVELTPGHQQVKAGVRVFDVSYDNSGLSVVTHHLKVRRQDKRLILSEFLELSNSSDMAVTSRQKDSKGKAVVLTLHLPKGFEDFSSSGYLVPEALGFTEDGFYDTMAIPPGNHQVIFSYALKIKSETMDIVKKIMMPTAGFVLFAQTGTGSVHGLGEPDGQVTLSDGVSADYFSRSDLTGGAEIAFAVTGLNVDRRDRNSLIVVAVVFGVIAVLAVLRLRTGKSRL